MKKSLLTLGAIAFTTLSFSQQQIGNSDLEQWEVVASPDEEPVNWNSFLTASGSLAQFASSQLTKETDVRPGSSGMYSARIFSNNVLGVIANGNLTVGRINMGSATPSSSNNYNSSVIADANFSEALTDEPDSIVFWVKFTPVNAADSGRVSAITHDSYAHRDPIDAASVPHTRAMAMYNFATTNGQWVRKSFPFNYTGAATTTDFILLTFATNKTPGGGSGNDQMWIDDVELIYNQGSNNLAENTADFADIAIQNNELVITADAGVNGNVAIYLASGQLLWSGDIKESYTFTQSGMYFVRLDTNRGTLVRRFNHF